MIGISTTMDASKKSRKQNQISSKCEICDKEFRINSGLPNMRYLPTKSCRIQRTPGT